MKKVYLALAIILATPSLSMATGQFGAMEVATECKIGEISTGYSVDKNNLTLKATIKIIDTFGLPVSSAEIDAGWTNGNEAISSAGCTTDLNGECTVTHMVKKFRGRHAKDLPQIGVRVLMVTCQDLQYTYVPNSTFAWAILN